MKNIVFQYVPLSFISTKNEVKRQSLNTVVFHQVLEKYGETKLLGDLLSKTQYGYTASAKNQGAVKFLRITDINNGSVNWDNVPYCDCDSIEKYKIKPKDILIARTGNNISYLVEENVPNQTVFASYLIRLICDQSKLLPDYLYLFLNSYAFWPQILLKQRGALLQNVNAKRMCELLIPYCPIEAQEDICFNACKNTFLDIPRRQNKVENILENNYSLRSELTHQQTLVKKLRQQILQEAIAGKLTAEWRSHHPDIEPASELLKRIAAEKAELVKAKKIKPQKPLSPITDEEKPFELPKGWEWCRLDQLIYESPRNGYSPKTVDFPTHVKTLKLGATTSGKFNATEIKYIDKEIPNDSFLWIKNRDILIQRGNSIDFVGVSAIYYGKDNCFIYPDLMMKLKPVSSLSEIYLHHTLMSFYCRDYFRKNAAGSQKSMPKINQNVVSTALIPLCSEDEQQAIVAKVEKLLTLCDQLETQITQNQTHAQQLMQAVLKEAFTPTSKSTG